MKKSIKSNNSGITLIALVVTIIVLIILAGIVIATLLGDNGIITKAGEAKISNEKAKIEELAELIRTDYIIAHEGEKPTAKYIMEELIAENEILANQVKDYGEDTGIGIIEFNNIEIEIHGEIEEYSDDIFVALYNDGTLVFSHDENSIDSSKVTTNYGNVKNETTRIWGNTWGEGITKVKILNKIKPTTMREWFSSMVDLTEIENIENINTSNVTDMSYTFALTCSLTQLDLSTFNTSNVTDMSYMFGCTNNDFTMYITTIRGLDKWNTGNVRYMNHMFIGLENLTEVDVSKFNTENVEDMTCMFHSCVNLTTIDISNFNMAKVTSANYMFYNCYRLTSIYYPDTAKIMGRRTFGNCSGLSTIYIPSSVETITTSEKSDSPFYGCSGSTIIYCGASAKQPNWGTYWNYPSSNAQLTVYYGYTRDQYNNIVNGG